MERLFAVLILTDGQRQDVSLDTTLEIALHRRNVKNLRKISPGVYPGPGGRGRNDSEANETDVFNISAESMLKKGSEGIIPNWSSEFAGL
jgi:hypothetical protein